MQQQKLAILFSFIAGLAQVTPSPTATATTGFASECTDITFNTNWLVANCPNEGGHFISSGVYLPNWVTNTEGKLEWQKDGGFTCDGCELLDHGATLQCYCYGTYANEDGYTTLNLEQYIANYNGHLLSNLEGTPSVPTDASLAFPSNPVLTLNPYEGPYLCPSLPAGYDLSYIGPEACTELNVGVGGPANWTAIRATLNEGWSVSVYNVSTCTGTPVATFDQHSVNECVTVGINGDAHLALTPLWNYD